MANAAPKKKPMRSVRSGRKKALLVKQNQETIQNIWTILNSQQVLKNF